MEKNLSKLTAVLFLLITAVFSFETSALCEHNYTLITHKEPTCTFQGKDTYLCSCGDVYTEMLSPFGHKFLLTSETKADYGKTGEKVYTCSVCGESYTETTAALSLTSVKGVKTEGVSNSSVKVMWDSTEGAKRYEVSYRFSDGKWQTESTEDTSWVLRGLKGASLYLFRVRAVCDGSSGPYSETERCYTKPDTVSVKTAETKTGSTVLSWTESEGASGYQIYYGKDKTFKDCRKVSAEGGKTLTKTLTSLSSSSVYYIKICPYLIAQEQKIYGDFSQVKETVTLPLAVSIKAASSKENAATIKWKEVSGVSGYCLEYSSSKNFSSAKNVRVTSTEYTVKNLTSCKTYYFRLKAYKTFGGENYYGAYGDAVSVTVKPSAVKFTSLTRSSNKVTVKWTAAENISGYEIKYSENKNFSSAETLRVSAGSECKKTITSLSSATSYYFKIRSYKTLNGEKIYGSYSSVKRVTTEPGKVSTKKIKAGEGKFVVTWDKVIGADSYQVVYSASENFRNSKKVTVKASSPLKKTLKKLRKGTVYYVKVRACKKVGGKTVYGQYSKTLSIRTLLGTAKVKNTAQGTNSISLAWNKVDSADGYEILYGTYSSFSDGKTVKAKGEDTLKAVLDSLESSKSYYIKVRAYKVVKKEKVYGQYSDRLKITTLPQKVSVIKTEKKNASTLKVYWSAAENVSGYELLYSESADFTKAKHITASGKASTSRVIKELIQGRTYYFKVRAYKTEDGKKVYGEYGQVKQVKM